MPCTYYILHKNCLTWHIYNKYKFIRINSHLHKKYPDLHKFCEKCVHILLEICVKLKRICALASGQETDDCYLFCFHSLIPHFCNRLRQKFVSWCDDWKKKIWSVLMSVTNIRQMFCCDVYDKYKTNFLSWCLWQI